MQQRELSESWATSVKSKIRGLIGPELANTALAGVWYGSKTRGSDLDLVIIQEEEPASLGILCGNLDLLVLGRTRFESLAKVRDPLVTEPLLSGSMLFGDSDFWRSALVEVKNTPTPEGCSTHCCRRGIEEALAAHNLCCTAEASGSLEHARWALENLSYSISYISFAKHYSEKRSRACTLEDLIRRKRILLPEFWTFWRANRRRRLNDIGAVRKQLDGWFRHIALNAGAGLPT